MSVAMVISDKPLKTLLASNCMTRHFFGFESFGDLCGDPIASTFLSRELPHPKYPQDVQPQQGWFNYLIIWRGLKEAPEPVYLRGV